MIKLIVQRFAEGILSAFAGMTIVFICMRILPGDPAMYVLGEKASPEALANIRKHAQADRVTVTLSYMDDQVALDIQDNGHGFDLALLSRPPNQEHGGFGLQTMLERLAQLGGQLIIESAPGEGTTLAAQIPMEVKP